MYDTKPPEFLINNDLVFESCSPKAKNNKRCSLFLFVIWFVIRRDALLNMDVNLAHINHLVRKKIKQSQNQEFYTINFLKFHRHPLL